MLLLQEVCTDDHGDQADEVASALGCAHVVWTEGHQTLGGSEGVAILSRVPLADVRVDQLPPSDPPRRMLRASVELGATAVRLVCAHRRGAGVRAHAPGRRAAGRSRRAADPGGDLNGTPDEVLPLARRAGFADALAGTTAPTWPVCDITFGDSWMSQFGRAPHFSLEARRIDHLLARGVCVALGGVHVLDGAEEGYASDHAAVWADIGAQRSVTAGAAAGRA